MEVFIIIIASFLASLLTFFSGFGLGTILLPVFAVWFSIDVAIALTAIVHFLNNFFKLVLVGKNVHFKTLLRFGIPAIIASLAGAYLLIHVSDLEPLFTYQHWGKTFSVTPIKLIIAVIMLAFTAFEVVPRLKQLQFDQKYLVVGGALSGFFGGLSGHQGALRSAFLIRATLSKEGFIATGTAIACLVDLTRMGVYSQHLTSQTLTQEYAILTIATLSAFAGAFIGNKLLKKVTLNTVQIFVSIGLGIMALAIGAGLI